MVEKEHLHLVDALGFYVAYFLWSLYCIIKETVSFDECDKHYTAALEDEMHTYPKYSIWVHDS